VIKKTLKDISATEQPIDTSRGVFKLGGHEVVLLGEYVHEVKGHVRDRFGQRVVQISKTGRRASDAEMRMARHAAEERILERQRARLLGTVKEAP
jgi:hypothetical protein